MKTLKTTPLSFKTDLPEVLPKKVSYLISDCTMVQLVATIANKSLASIPKSPTDDRIFEAFHCGFSGESGVAKRAVEVIWIDVEHKRYMWLTNIR